MALFRRKPAPDEPERRDLDPVELALGYHQRTKHHYQRFAASLGYLDWDNQPDPFRRYADAERTRLPRPSDDDTPSWAELHTPGAVPPRPLDLEGVSRLLYFGMALSAHKRAGDARWALRVNPSSGNLHPTECTLLLPELDGLGVAGVQHYAPDEHALERRASLCPDGWPELASSLPEGGFLLVLSSVVWREAWKYGERAWRYCQHDVGHALAALRYAAAMNGWSLAALPDTSDALVAALAGLDRIDYAAEDAATGDGEPADADAPPSDIERELPDLVLLVRPDGLPVDPRTHLDPSAARAALATARWQGRANRLSDEHQPWPILEIVEQACTRDSSHEPFAQEPVPRAPDSSAAPPQDGTPGATVTPKPQPFVGQGAVPAGRLVRARRSAVAMDGRTSMSRAAFVELLASSVPCLAPLPFDALGAPTRVHLALFVHRVDELAPGLYVLVRHANAVPRLSAAMREGFRWERPTGIPEALPLWRLLDGDLRTGAARLCCGQEIAGDGAFSLGMLAELEPSLRRWGAPVYRNLFWETGAVGQALYLQAEAAGLRATGIGCFFDDPVHELLGLRDLAFQSLYHFTVGGAVDDERLSTEPAYDD